MFDKSECESFPLKNDDFTKIIQLSKEIKPGIEFSSYGLEEFWRLEG